MCLQSFIEMTKIVVAHPLCIQFINVVLIFEFLGIYQVSKVILHTMHSSFQDIKRKINFKLLCNDLSEDFLACFQQLRVIQWLCCFWGMKSLLIKPYFPIMTSSSKIIEKAVSFKVSGNSLIHNEACKPPNFKAYLNIAIKGDTSGSLSLVPPRVILIHDVRCC